MRLYAILLACSSAHGLNLGAARSLTNTQRVRRATDVKLYTTWDAEATAARVGRCLGRLQRRGRFGAPPTTAAHGDESHLRVGILGVAVCGDEAFVVRGASAHIC